MEYVTAAIEYARAGFAEVNHLRGLIILLFAVLMLPDGKSVPAFALTATVFHILIDVFAPVFANGSDLRLPPLFEVDFWEQVLLLSLIHI